MRAAGAGGDGRVIPAGGAGQGGVVSLAMNAKSAEDRRTDHEPPGVHPAGGAGEGRATSLSRTRAETISNGRGAGAGGVGGGGGEDLERAEGRLGEFAAEGVEVAARPPDRPPAEPLGQVDRVGDVV